MTYVSRKTRITVSRWSDECNAEYTLRACKKRSEGRLKRHASCDDIRAWMNDNCVRHELLVDLMSDGEFLGKPPFRLYGRFIPVPILFKLTQKTRINSEEEADDASASKGSVRKTKSSTGKCECEGGTANSARKVGSICAQMKKSNSNIRSQDCKLDSKNSLTRLEREKCLLEKKLCECTCLLNKAVGQLEKIDNIVGFSPDETDHAEDVRNKQIRNAFKKSKEMCTCSLRNNNSPNLSPSRSYVRKLKESARCAELMRKISGLREKLKKIQECRQEISQQIRISKIRAENCSSSHQVTELYSRREQAHIKRLQKKLEKLIAERGKLLSEMCQTLACLNSIKKTSRSSVCFSTRRSKTNRNSEICLNEKPGDCSCGCTCSEYNESTDSERVRCSESSFGESGINRGFVKSRHMNLDLNNGLEEHDIQANCAEEFFDEESFDSAEQYSGDEDNCRSNAEHQRFPECKRAATPELCSPPTQKAMKNQTKDGNSSKTGKSSVKFICPESSCKRKLYADDLSAYEDSLSPAQQTLILGALKNIENRRPTTSPTTKRERDAAALEQNRPCGPGSQRNPNKDLFLERQIKSETTMKEIEKTLRNYEQRLSQLGSLECKIEELKEKSSEVDRLKQYLERMKAEMKEQKAIERENSNREITKLCSENWALKKQVQQLTAKFEAQCKKVQNLKSGIMKARELECEAEELKKELSEYRDSFEHQRKCISKWESVVAVQRTEIENLMNHIRKLTTMKEETASNIYQMKKVVQRSRSYSPEIKTRGMSNRGKLPKNCRLSSEEEDSPCCCNECLQGMNRRRSHQRNSERTCCAPPTRGMEWCN